jgi:hypothetical protein
MDDGSAFPTQQPVDRSAFGLQIQHQQVDALARGSNLGIGQRVTPNPASLFSQPPMSHAQFMGGPNPKATFGQTALPVPGGPHS